LLVHPKLGAPVRYETVHLRKAARIQQEHNALPGRFLARLVLLLDAIGPSAYVRELKQALELKLVVFTGSGPGFHARAPFDWLMADFFFSSE
jgi:sulfite reductase beta subunit-like hemoprotein